MPVTIIACTANAYICAGQRASTRDRGPAAKKLEFSVKQFHDAAKEGDKDRVSLLLELKGANVKVRQVNYGVLTRGRGGYGLPATCRGTTKHHQCRLSRSRPTLITMKVDARGSDD